MKTYLILVEEHFIHRFKIKASSVEEAIEAAEELAVQGQWDDSESVLSDRQISEEDQA